jgi:hypothetical protein
MKPFPRKEPDDESNTPDPIPETEPTGPGQGGGRRPRRRTAVGQGGPDDHNRVWEEKIADLRRYDLDALETERWKQLDFISWPLPHLTFFELSGVSSAGEEAPDEQLLPVSPNPDQNPIERRVYSMEDALIGLNNQKANLCFCAIGSQTAVKYYLGMSLPGIIEAEENETNRSDYDALKSILQSACNDIQIFKDPFTSESLKTMIMPLTRYVGVVTGVPALKPTAKGVMDWDQISSVATGMKGQDFGIMILAVPIPNDFVSREEFNVIDQIQRAMETNFEDQKRRIEYYLELQNAYLKHIQLGTAIGSWQVGVYFFAPDTSSFSRLKALLRETYADEASRPTPLRTHEMYGLKEHVEQFGLLRNTRAEKNVQTLLCYRFLTPLNSRSLSAYVHIPST